jgi:hypothetical protein
MTTPKPEEEGITFVTQTPVPHPLLIPGGTKTRITIAGDALVLSKVFVGSVADKPFKATELHQVFFNGQPSVTLPPMVWTPPPSSPDMPVEEGDTQDIASIVAYPFSEVTSDPLPVGINAARGLLISAHIMNDYLAAREIEPGWSAKYRAGDFAADLDKSSDELDNDPYTPAEQSVLGVVVIEQYNPPPPPPPLPAPI